MSTYDLQCGLTVRATVEDADVVRGDQWTGDTVPVCHPETIEPAGVWNFERWHGGGSEDEDNPASYVERFRRSIAGEIEDQERGLARSARDDYDED